MIKDELHIYKDTALLSEAFTHFLQEKVLTGKEISLALSGGSTPKVIFDYWSENCKTELPWDKILLFWGDERCVPPNDSMNNYAMTKEHLLDKIDIPTNNIFRIHGENEPDEEAVWYSNVLNAELAKANKIPEFDLVILGLGDDGHTASIFPYQIDLWNSMSNCVVAAHPESGMKRISITGRIINNAKHVVILSTGEGKAKRVKEIIKTREQFINVYPAAKIAPKSKQLHWFLDEAAASLL